MSKTVISYRNYPMCVECCKYREILFWAFQSSDTKQRQSAFQLEFHEIIYCVVCTAGIQNISMSVFFFSGGWYAGKKSQTLSQVRYSSARQTSSYVDWYAVAVGARCFFLDTTVVGTEIAS